jgi:hypothetical protein
MKMTLGEFYTNEVSPNPRCTRWTPEGSEERSPNHWENHLCLAPATHRYSHTPHRVFHFCDGHWLEFLQGGTGSLRNPSKSTV